MSGSWRLSLFALLLFGACTEMGPNELRGVVDRGIAAGAVAPGATEGGDPAGCSPGTDGPVWGEEGEPLAVALRCRSGLALAPGALVAVGLPAGAQLDATNNVLSWRPGLDQAGVYVVSFKVKATGETGSVKVGIADRFDDPHNIPIRNPLIYSEEMGVPVFQLTLPSAPVAGDDDYVSGALVYRGRLYGVGAKLHGRSSLDYPKKSYALKFSKEAPFSEPAHGFVDRRKITLLSTFDDNSYLRQRLAFEVWNRAPARRKIELHHFSAVLFVNGEYRGLYTVADLMSAEVIAASGLPADGNLYKAVDHDANFITPPTPEVYEKKEGVTLEQDPAAYDDLKDLVSFVADTDDDTFRDGIGSRLDLASYADWLITCTAINASDSLGKNAYHYHDPAADLWRVVPWDFNASFGQAWNTMREAPDGDPVELAKSWNHLFARLLDDTQIGGELRRRYVDTLSGELSVDEVLALVDSLAGEVGLAAHRDERRWRGEYLGFERWSDRTDFTDYDGELVYLRGWITERWAHLGARF